jgi:hypothetical protein
MRVRSRSCCQCRLARHSGSLAGSAGGKFRCARKQLLLLLLHQLQVLGSAAALLACWQSSVNISLVELAASAASKSSSLTSCLLNLSCLPLRRPATAFRADLRRFAFEVVELDVMAHPKLDGAESGH